MELTSEQLAAIGTAVARALPVPVAPVASVRSSPRDRHSWVAIAALVCTVLALMGVGFGAWVSSSNNQASQSVKINNIADTVVKNGSRIDRLEQAPPPVSISPQQLQDLKDSFAEFRAQYKEDTRDMKQQIQTLQDRKAVR